jgi:hypothetical protein
MEWQISSISWLPYSILPSSLIGISCMQKTAKKIYASMLFFTGAKIKHQGIKPTEYWQEISKINFH